MTSSVRVQHAGTKLAGWEGVLGEVLQNRWLTHPQRVMSHESYGQLFAREQIMSCERSLLFGFIIVLRLLEYVEAVSFGIGHALRGKALFTVTAAVAPPACARTARQSTRTTEMIEQVELPMVCKLCSVVGRGDPSLRLRSLLAAPPAIARLWVC